MFYILIILLADIVLDIFNLYLCAVILTVLQCSVIVPATVPK